MVHVHDPGFENGVSKWPARRKIWCDRLQKGGGVQFHSVEGKEHNLFSQDLTNGFSMETRNHPWIHHSDDGFNPLKFT